MTFGGNIVYLCPRSVNSGPSAARDTHDTARVRINNIPDKSQFLLSLLSINKAKYYQPEYEF